VKEKTVEDEGQRLLNDGRRGSEGDGEEIAHGGGWWKLREGEGRSMVENERKPSVMKG
jgi:hypothetical protein